MEARSPSKSCGALSTCPLYGALMSSAGRELDYLNREHSPPHPGEFLAAVYLEPFGVSGRELAAQLDVSPSTLSRVLKGTSRVTPEMALRLSKAVGRSAESWLVMQDAHDLWVARQTLDLGRVQALDIARAS
ncbi:MAG: HigA family addiction module antidote protein [Chryseoglobus sp.]|nr:HigA family addiction module antitoxin [Microcella sp.]MBX9471757.1 HigA family addiction module antidote protein [Microcella sp.]